MTVRIWWLALIVLIVVLAITVVIYYLVRQYRWGQNCVSSPPNKSNLIPKYLTSIDLQTDVNNCGLIGTKCRTTLGEICTGGFCVCSDAKLTQCAEGCVNLKSDVNNCGTCGKTCRVGEICNNGSCVCAAGAVICGNQCVNLSDDRLNCGLCGSVCPDGKDCVQGVCQTPLSCGNTQTSIENCGTCGNRCFPAGPLDHPYTGACCGGVCTNLAQDELNCGICGNICPSGFICVEGTCVDVENNARYCGQQLASCGYGQICCAGQCVNVVDDPNNCGQCGNVCPSALPQCIRGVCAKEDPFNCGVPSTNCVSLYGGAGVCLNGVCLDKQTSSEACGANLSVCANDGVTKCCRGVCTAINTNDNCGSCGNNCAAIYADPSADPACVWEASTGNFVCVDRNTNRQHCGTDDINCGNSDCVGGVCLSSAALVTSCGPENTNCTAIGAARCCAGKCYRDNDPYNCGGCNVTCFPGSSCIQVGATYQCINLSTSNTNCGVPGRVCAGTEVCISGQCISFSTSNCGTLGYNCNSLAGNISRAGCCPTPSSSTLYSCVDLNNDIENCGACGTVCPGGANAICVNGVCLNTSSTSCGLNQQNCSSLAGVTAAVYQCCNQECVRVKLNPISTTTPYPADSFTNCGTCNSSPPGNYLSGWRCCNGAYKNTQSDASNCGQCGKVCVSPTPNCSNGKNNCRTIPAPNKRRKTNQGGMGTSSAASDSAKKRWRAAMIAVLVVSLVLFILFVFLLIRFARQSNRSSQLAPLPNEQNETKRKVIGSLLMGGLIGGLVVGLLYLLRSTWRASTCREVQIAKQKATFDASSNNGGSELGTNSNCGTQGNQCDTTGGQRCDGEKGICVCQVANTTYCGSGQGCVDLLTNESNCGACGIVCGAGQTCIDGNCVCLGTQCGNDCVSLRSDNNNCGSCGIVCPPFFTCIEGQCVSSAILVPDTQNDVLNCGRLDNQCYGVGAQCCGGICSMRMSDNLNCGECGNVCNTQTGEQCCFGKCTNVESDVLNCGTCGASCPVGLYCYQGKCVSLGTNDNCSSLGDTCLAGFTCMHGVCVSNTDPDSNCGPSQANCLELFGNNEGRCFNNSKCFDSKNSASGCLAFSSQPRLLTYVTWDAKTNAQYIETSCLTAAGWLQAVQYCNYVVTSPFTDPLTLNIRTPSNGAVCHPLDPVLSAPLNWSSTVFSNPPPSNCAPNSLPNQGGSICCQGILINPFTDDNHCGQCGVDCKQIYGADGVCKDGACYNTLISSNACGINLAVCASGQLCQNGVCVNSALINSSTNQNCAGVACALNETCCGGRCRDTRTDEIACGACDNRCPYGYTCLSGVCVDLRSSNSLCYKPPDNQDPINSALALPVVCAPNQVCSNGVCVNIGTTSNCSGLGDDCALRYGIYGACKNGSCVRTQYRNDACGTNGNYTNCAATQACVNGSCVDAMSSNCATSTCPPGTFCANNVCVPCIGPNCGSCGPYAGFTCSSTQLCCRSACIDPLSDPNNCGGCGNVCAVGKICSGGVCV